MLGIYGWAKWLGLFLIPHYNQPTNERTSERERGYLSTAGFISLFETATPLINGRDNTMWQYIYTLPKTLPPYPPPYPPSPHGSLRSPPPTARFAHLPSSSKSSKPISPTLSSPTPTPTSSSSPSRTSTYPSPTPSVV